MLGTVFGSAADCHTAASVPSLRASEITGSGPTEYATAIASSVPTIATSVSLHALGSGLVHATLPLPEIQLTSVT